MKPELLNDYPEKVLLGSNPIEGKIYLTKPEWQCDWYGYWSFGWIGDKNLHTHLDRLGSSNMYNNIKEFIPNVKLSDTNLWKFCELAESIYTLKKSAELFHRGGSHIVYNAKYRGVMQNKERCEYINYVTIPALIDELYKVLLDETNR